MSDAFDDIDDPGWLPEDELDPLPDELLVADERVTVAALSPAQAGSVLAAGPPPGDLDRSRLRAVICRPSRSTRRCGPASGIGSACRCCRTAECSSVAAHPTTVSSDAATWYFACSCLFEGKMP